MPRSERLLRSIQDPSTNARDDKDHFCLQRSFGARGLKTGLPKIAAKRDFWERGAAGATGKAASKARRLPWRLDATSLLRMTGEDGARSTYSLVTLSGAARRAPRAAQSNGSYQNVECKVEDELKNVLIFPKFYILHLSFTVLTLHARQSLSAFHSTFKKPSAAPKRKIFQRRCLYAKKYRGGVRRHVV